MILMIMLEIRKSQYFYCQLVSCSCFALITYFSSSIAWGMLDTFQLIRFSQPLSLQGITFSCHSASRTAIFENKLLSISHWANYFVIIATLFKVKYYLTLIVKWWVLLINLSNVSQTFGLLISSEWRYQ